MKRNRILEFIDYWLMMAEHQRQKVFERLLGIEGGQLGQLALPLPRQWSLLELGRVPLVIGEGG